jgi:hypothetical protein
VKTALILIWRNSLESGQPAFIHLPGKKKTHKAYLGVYFTKNEREGHWQNLENAIEKTIYKF